MYCELKSIFALLVFTNRYLPLSLSIDYHSQMYSICDLILLNNSDSNQIYAIIKNKKIGCYLSN